MKYHKISTVYERNPETKFRTLLEGKFATPEFEYLQKNEWVFTEKIDGTNIRVMWDGKKLLFGGKKEGSEIPTFLHDVIQEIFTTEWMREHWGNAKVTLYGEGYGNKIQKAGKAYKSDGVGFILFDINAGGTWLIREDVEDIGKEWYGVPVVPIVGVGNLVEGITMAKRGFTSLIAEDKEFLAEGLVMRPAIEMLDRLGNRIVTKIKRRDFPENK